MTSQKKSYLCTWLVGRTHLRLYFVTIVVYRKEAKVSLPYARSGFGRHSERPQSRQRLQRKRQSQNPEAEKTRLLCHDRILDAARSHIPLETCCFLGATVPGDCPDFDPLPADRLHPLQFCLTIIRRKLVPYNNSTHTRQLQLQA